MAIEMRFRSAPTARRSGSPSATPSSGSLPIILKLIINIVDFRQGRYEAGKSPYYCEYSTLLLEAAMTKLGLSACAYTRVLKVACSIAGLDGPEHRRGTCRRGPPVPEPGRALD